MKFQPMTRDDTEFTLASGQKLRVMPEGQKVKRWANQPILITHFDDHPLIAPALCETVLRQEAEGKSHQFNPSLGAASAKTYNVSEWGTPEADLIDARARAMYRRIAKGKDGWVDESWSTIYRDGSFTMPHSHPRNIGSVLYMLEPGDTSDEISGRFRFVDPRLDVCCQTEKGFMTTPAAPDIKPGTMIIFPSQVVHMVTPYKGDRPRITMSWDIGDKQYEDSQLPEHMRFED